MELLFTGIFFIALFIHTYTDFKEMLLYDSVNIILGVFGCWRALYLRNIISAFIGAIVVFLVMLILYYISKGGMGEGDVKLTCVLGLWLGIKFGLIMLLLAFIGGGIVCGSLYINKRINLQQQIPFGPFLCISSILVYFYGNIIWQWYISLFRW